MSLKLQYVLNRKKHCTYQSKRCHLHQFKIAKSSLFQQSISNQVWLKYKEKQVVELISETNLHRRINEGNSWLSNSDNRFNRKYKCYKRHNRFCMHSLKLDFVFLQIDQINQNKFCSHTNKSYDNLIVHAGWWFSRWCSQNTYYESKNHNFAFNFRYIYLNWLYQHINIAISLIGIPHDLHKNMFDCLFHIHDILSFITSWWSMFDQAAQSSSLNILVQDVINKSCHLHVVYYKVLKQKIKLPLHNMLNQ